MELYLESPLNVDVDIMPPSEVEKIFRAFAEKRKAELPRFTPDGIPITMENKFDDAIYNYLYEYWKTNSGEYDPKKDVIPESEMNKMHPRTKNEFQFEKWLFEQYGMTKKEERGYTLEGNLDSLWEIFSAADMMLFARGLPSIGKELVQLGKKAVDDVAEEAIEKTVKREVSEEAVENTAKKEMADTTEDLSQKTADKDNILEDSNDIEQRSEVVESINPSAKRTGAERAAQYSASWKDGSVIEAINKFAPNANPIYTDKGKIIFRNASTGIEVVYDKNGNYFRIVDTNLTGKRTALDLNGNRIPNNVITEKGTQRGMTQGEYNAATHFNNTDINFNK